MKGVGKKSVSLVDARKVEANALVDTKSLVTKYEVLMREHDAGLVSEERSALLFQVLDNILPHLGVFKPLLSKIRDELYEYVFSDEHHTAKASRMTNLSDSRSQSTGSASIERIPYYLLLKKLVASRDNNADGLQNEMDKVQESLFKKQIVYEDAVSTIALRNKQISELKMSISELESELGKRESMIRRLHEEIKSNQMKNQEIVDELNRQFEHLQHDCNEKDALIEQLKVYKKGYDDLDKAFLNETDVKVVQHSSKNRFLSHDQNSVIATKQEHLHSDIAVCKKLEVQILTVMNTIIEQYDVFLEEHKSDLAKKRLMYNKDIIETRKMEREIDLADQELWMIQERFKSSMEEINNEVNLLRQHYSMLEEELSSVEADIKEKSKPVDKKKLKNKIKQKAPGDPITYDEIIKMSIDPSDYVEEDYEEDEFIPHERVFSKYAVMLYYSQDAGKTFYMHQDCTMCDSCHEKTIACPHKVTGEGRTVLLPHKVTHIMLKRPDVRILKETEKDDSRTPHSTTPLNYPKMSASSKADRIGSTEARKLSTATTSSLGTGKHLAYIKHSLEDIWKDFEVRTQMKRYVGRNLSLDRTISLYEQFHAFVAWQDQNASDDEGYGSALDNVYHFFGERYLKEEAQYAAVHDFFKAVIHFSKENKQLELFANALVGNVDFSACRYLLLLSNYIESIEWKDVEDFRSFVASVYPFIQDEDLESMQMGYVSFSENKISKLHVFEYIIYLALKGREPRIQDLEHQLMQYPCREMGQMSDEEFSEASAHILQVPDEKLRKALFAESLLLVQNTQSDVFLINVSKLACILAYLQLLELSSTLDASIHQFIADNRPTREETLGVHGHVVQLDPSVHLITMENVLNLSFNVARRERCRKDRVAFEADF